MPQDRMWVTPEAQQRLKAELDGLVARGDDATDAARARIVELRTILESVDVAARPDDGLVEPGMRVTVRGVDDSIESAFVLGDRALLRPDLGADVEVVSDQSPLGAAVNHRHVGEQVTFVTPRGDRAVLITGASPVG